MGAEAEDTYEGPLLGLGGEPQRSYEEVRGAPCGLSLNQGKTAHGRDTVLGQDRARCSTGVREDRPPDSPECGPWVRGHGSVWKPPIGLMGHGAGERSDGAGVFPQFHVSPSGEAPDSQFAGSPSASSNRCLGDFADSHLDDAPQTFDRSGEKKKMKDPSEVRECGRVEKLVGLPWGSCLPLVQSLLIKSSSKLKKKHSEAKPTGDVFPLPTSTDILRGQERLARVDVVMLRSLCLGLNSYAGVDLESGARVTPLQLEFLEGLCGDLAEVSTWEETFSLSTWESFFSSRSVDYVGDEVSVAKTTSWSNLSPAIPAEVGGVELSSVLEGGCRHYVTHFEDYLVPPESMEYTKPPRVMVADDQWEGVCRGLLSSGICGLLPESELFHVKGRPLLNGLFGVPKGDRAGGIELHRLIMNLIPLNNICRPIQGDVSTLPAWSSAGPLMLMPTQQLLIGSEDVRCFFYIFKVPAAWQKFLGFNKAVPTHLHPGQTERHFLVSRVLPMGFRNSVSLAQAVHRSVVRRAKGRTSNRLLDCQELRKDRPFPNTDLMHRIYLDNFDELERMDGSLAALLKGSPSPSILALRAEYEAWGIPRHPKKAVQRSLRAEVQGAMVDGDKGCAYPKPDKILKYTQLALLMLDQGKCSQKQMQVVAGGLVYIATFRRALMGGLNHIWAFIEEFNKYPPVIRLEIPYLVELEISRFIALLPLARINFRALPNPQVTASDASTTGGGVTVSRGLTNLGRIATLCPSRGDVPELGEMTQVLTIGLFDGIGALRVAADAAGLPMAGHVSVEMDASASRVLESKFPATQFVSNVESVDLDMVRQWACQFSQVGLVILGAGPPCQGVSGLNADRRGALKDYRSKLYVHVARIRDLVRVAFPWAQVHSLAESVQSMDVEDRMVMSESFGTQSWAIDASGVSLARRPRLYWITWALQTGEGVTIEIPPDDKWESMGKVKLEGKVESDKYLVPGWRRLGEQPLPTFTTSRPRQHPGRRPAGLDMLTAAEKTQWEEDKFRFPPYQYQTCHQVGRGDVHRLVNAEEREVILGFPRHYTVNCLPKSKQGSTEHQDLRLTLLGNSWNVTVITWLLSQLGAWLGVSPQLTIQHCIERTSPGANTDFATFLTRQPMNGPRKALIQGGSDLLVKKLLNLVSIKGEDILVNSASEETLKYHRLRASIPANLWKWSTVCGWKWRGHKEHINVLELRAVLCAMRYRTTKQRVRDQRIIHLTDSLVCLHTLTRGRTSSKKLRRTLARINALLLLTRNTAVWTYAHTALNPADAPSRGRIKRKWGRK